MVAFHALRNTLCYVVSRDILGRKVDQVNAHIVHNLRAGIGELRFCWQWAFKHAPLLRIPPGLFLL